MDQGTVGIIAALLCLVVYFIHTDIEPDFEEKQNGYGCYLYILLFFIFSFVIALIATI